MLVEAVRFGAADEEIQTVRPEVSLGPTLLDGICGRSKRVIEVAGHSSVRDEFI